MNDLDIQCIAWLARINGNNEVVECTYRAIVLAGKLGPTFAFGKDWYNILDQERAAEIKRNPAYYEWGKHPVVYPCGGFAWIGQSLKHCDHCGDPIWEHGFMQTIDSFNGGWVYRPISPAKRSYYYNSLVGEF